MKPAVFAYHAPDTVEEAIDLLGSVADAKILAGGQSLVPAMNFRLARPEALVDINRIAGLDYTATADGYLEIGALARHARFESPVEPGALGRLLAQVARWVGHHPIRVRGTFAGSIAHADPAAEWCVVAHTLDATMIARGPGAERAIGAADFFHTLFSTDLAPDEVLTAVRVPLLAPSEQAGFSQFARRAGDFALAMAFVVCDVTEVAITKARVGLGGVSDRPVRVTEAEAALVGMPADDVVRASTTAAAIAADTITPLGDIHGSAGYRTDLIRAMVRRATAQALAQ